MPQHVEGFAVLVGEDLEGERALAHTVSPARRGGRQLAVEIDDRAVDLGGDGRLGETLADRLGHLARPGAFGDLLAGAIGQAEGEHEQHLPGKQLGPPLQRACPNTRRGRELEFTRSGSERILFAGPHGDDREGKNCEKKHALAQQRLVGQSRKTRFGDSSWRLVDICT